MGSSISAIMSEIYLQDFKEKIITGITHTHNVLLWKRYVDDILVIYKPNIKNEHLIILNKLHTYNKNLKFTYEIDINRTINYLDIRIQLNKDNITTDIHRKPSYNNITIHKDSKSPMVTQKWNIL